MIDLNFSREFFAAMLVTEVEKVGFAVLRSGISKSGDEIRFTAVDYVYRESEFRKKYVNRVVNPFLT